MIERLRKPADFARVRERGAARRGRLCAVNVARRAPAKTSSEADGESQSAATRVGFITSKRVGNAVQRNRARRLMSEAVRALAGELPLDYDIVIVALSPLAQAGAKMQHARAELRNHLVVLKLIEPPRASDEI